MSFEKTPSFNYINNSDEYLVSLVHRHPDLYNRDNEHYRDDDHKRASWIFIGKALEMDVETVKKRWENLRDRFVRAYREYCDHSPTTTEIMKVKFKLFDKMMWLSPYIRKRKITSAVAASRKKLCLKLTTGDDLPINENQSNETQDSLNLKTEIQSVSSDISIHDNFDLEEEAILSSTSKQIETVRLRSALEENGGNKSDHYFMMSVIQDCQNLPPRKKFKFKRDVLELLERYMYEDDA